LAIPKGFLSDGTLWRSARLALLCFEFAPDRIFRVSGEENVEEEENNKMEERNNIFMILASGIAQWIVVSTKPLPRTAVQNSAIQKEVATLLDWLWCGGHGYGYIK
jgi:hypothetical protein